MYSHPSHSNVSLLSKHGVLHVQMRLLGVREEELGAVGVGAVVCHGDHSSDVMLAGRTEHMDTRQRGACYCPGRRRAITCVQTTNFSC